VGDNLMSMVGPNIWRFVFMQQQVLQLFESFIAYPPMQKPASFNIQEVKDRIEQKMKQLQHE
jgi:arylsulfatase